MENCPLCGGDKKTGLTIYSINLGFGIVLVKDTPAEICNQCGEEWIEANTAKKLESIVENAKKSHCQLEVIQYQAA